MARTLATAATQLRPSASADTATRALFERYTRSRDGSIREQLIKRHSDLVEKVARGFMASGEPLEDLIQEGYLGLIKAVDSYDVRRDVKFTTYATHTISGEIRHYLRDRKTLIREPGWLHELSQKISRAIDRLTQNMDQAPSVGDIARETNLTEEAVLEVMRTRSVFRVASLDAESDNSDSESAIALDRRKIRSQRHVTGQLPVEDRIVLDEAVQKLKGLEKRVIFYLFYKDFNQTEIARKLGISCNYVSHLVRTSLKRLRQMLTTAELREAHLRLKALEGRQLMAEAVEGASALDEVTGLCSARAFRERAEAEFLRAQRYAHELSIVFFDLDGFGEFNRRHGFVASDALLAEIGRLTRRNVRKVDVACRYSSDTFSILLPHTSVRGGLAVARRLVRQVAETDLSHVTRSSDRASVSAGVAGYPSNGTGVDEVLEAALTALASAKGQGPGSLEEAKKTP
jgi:RNA polymerase sigma factor (sigma-70 family)